MCPFRDFSFLLSALRPLDATEDISNSMILRHPIDDCFALLHCSSLVHIGQFSLYTLGVNHRVPHMQADRYSWPGLKRCMTPHIVPFRVSLFGPSLKDNNKL